MYTAYVPVRSFEAQGSRPADQPALTAFPVIIGRIKDLNSFHGDIPKADERMRLGLRKAAHQHHRSAIITDNGIAVEMVDGARRLLVCAKGANMSWPNVGLTSDSDRRSFPYTFGLVSASELGNQFTHMTELQRAGVRTERLVGCYAIEAYIVEGHRIDREEFAANALASYIRKAAGARVTLFERIRREEAIREYLTYPHIIFLRAMESELRLSDLQDEPQIHEATMLQRVRASGEISAEKFTLTDYLQWLQERSAQNLRSMHEAGFVHRALYHGGNITTNAEIVDLDTLRRPEDYGADNGFELAQRQDVLDMAKNIKLLQKAFGRKPDAQTFSSIYAA